MSETFSPIVIQAIWIFVLIMRGITEASATLNFDTPSTLKIKIQNSRKIIQKFQIFNYQTLAASPERP